MLDVDIKEVLEAGTHFGHQKEKWNPKMAKYIYSRRNDIHIIDLEKSLQCLKEAYNFVREVSKNGSIVFVGTKKQAQDVIKEEAERAGVFYVNHRWVGGTLTNFQTIRKAIWRLIDLEKKEESGEFESLQKRERIKLLKEKARLTKILGGIKGLEEGYPSAIYIVDSVKEKICVNEAIRMGIPTIAIVDTNGDPDKITYPIPGNDDAIRSIKFITSCIANAVIEGRNSKEAKNEELEESLEAKNEQLEESSKEKLEDDRAY